MNDIATRIAKLPPEKRKLLEWLEQTPPAPPGVAEAADTADHEPILEDRYFSLEPGVFPDKEDLIKLYDAITQQLDATDFGAFSLFLNWGYVANENPRFSQFKLPDMYLNKNPTRLVLEVLGDCQVRPEDNVLDVGCGRGGTIFVLRKFFNAGKITGLDLSPQAISFCRKAHTYPNTYFVEGDAQALPMEEESVTIVTNLESSHCYPDVAAFYSEVCRVLRPGGYFLYADMFPAKRIEECLGLLYKTGLRIERNQDITSNVLLSCDDIANQHAKAFSRANNQSVMNNFLGIPNSTLYNAMRVGQCKYLLLKFRKSC